MGTRIDQQIEESRIQADRVERSGLKDDARMAWRAAYHTPIPKGSRVIFKDGDRRNTEPENMELVIDSGQVLDQDIGPGESKHMKMLKQKPTVSDADLKAGIRQTEMRANWAIKHGKLAKGEWLEQIDTTDKKNIRASNLRIKVKE